MFSSIIWINCFVFSQHWQNLPHLGTVVGVVRQGEVASDLDHQPQQVRRAVDISRVDRTSSLALLTTSTFNIQKYQNCWLTSLYCSFSMLYRSCGPRLTSKYWPMPLMTSMAILFFPGVISCLLRWLRYCSMMLFTETLAGSLNNCFWCTTRSQSFTRTYFSSSGMSMQYLLSILSSKGKKYRTEDVFFLFHLTKYSPLCLLRFPLF